MASDMLNVRGFCVLGAAALAVMTSPAALAFRSGPISGVTGSPGDGLQSCALCHGSAAGKGSVQILGAPTRYTPNHVYNLTVKISDPVQLGAGFELTVEKDATSEKVGTLIVSDPAHTQFGDSGFSPEWIEHTFNGVASAVADWTAMGNSAEYHVQWKAPAENVGGVTFYAAGNSINNNFRHSGDTIYLTSAAAQFNNCPPDLNADGMVNSSDMAALLSGWGPSGGGADISGDGVVNSTDLALLLGAWGACP